MMAYLGKRVVDEREFCPDVDAPVPAPDEDEKGNPDSTGVVGLDRRRCEKL